MHVGDLLVAKHNVGSETLKLTLQDIQIQAGHDAWKPKAIAVPLSKR
jgi:hypothetical protein